jgi:hypothetical protein
MTEPKKRTNMLFSCKPVMVEDNDILVRLVQVEEYRLALVLCNSKGTPIGAGNLLSIVFNRDGKMGQMSIHSSVNQKQDVIMLDEGRNIYCDKYSREPSRYQRDYLERNPRPQGQLHQHVHIGDVDIDPDEDYDEDFFDDLEIDEEDR